MDLMDCNFASPPKAAASLAASALPSDWRLKAWRLPAAVLRPEVAGW